MPSTVGRRAASVPAGERASTSAKDRNVAKLDVAAATPPFRDT
jgi:hypothetical protein